MGEEGGKDYSKFAVTRSYFTTKVKILPMLSARVTMDGRQDDTGDMKVRLKYAYGKFEFGDWGGLNKVGLEAGIVHMVWLDFEEHIDMYRMRDKMFMETVGPVQLRRFRADPGRGVWRGPLRRVSGRSEPLLPLQVRKLGGGCVQRGRVSRNREERGQDVQGRLTVRPLPDVLPGFQLSGLAIMGEGNQEGEPDETPDLQGLQPHGLLPVPQRHRHRPVRHGRREPEGKLVRVGRPVHGPGIRRVLPLRRVQGRAPLARSSPGTTTSTGPRRTAT